MSFLFGTNSNTDENEQLKNELQRLGNTIQKLMDEKNTLKQENNNLKINYDEHVFLGTLLHTREDSVKIYVSSCRKLIPNVLPWQYNRKLDEAHVIHLQDIILMKKSLEGNIDILECNEELCVVNGQHRVQALQEIMRNDESFTMELIVNVHPVPSFDSPEANDIFTATNNSKNVEMKDRPDIKLQNICNRLVDRYPKGIKNNPTGKATLHRLDKKQLYNLIQNNESFLNENNSEDYLFNKIIDLNTTLSNQTYEDLFGSKRTSKKKNKLYDGACKDGFYLGLKGETQLAILFQNFV